MLLEGVLPYMKILHILNTNRFSGAENVVCQIIDLFSSDGKYEMLYCSPKGDIENSLKEHGVKYIGIDSLTCKEIKRVLKEQKPDVIHAHDMRASFISSCVCGKIPLISHIHNNAYDSRAISFKSIAYLKAATKARHIFWVSQSAFEGYAFHKLFVKKSSVLYNTINIKRLLEKAESDKNQYNYDVVFLGRLTYQKNPHKLINVCSNLIAMKSDVRVAVIGTGNMEQDIVELVAQKGLSENITFLGFQNNPYKIVKDAKCMVMTSRWEGTPMCALEGMALGVPMVATPVDGLKKLIVNGENGFLCEDDLIFAQRVFDIVTNRDLYKRLSREQIIKSKQLNDLKKYKEMINVRYEY